MTEDKLTLKKLLSFEIKAVILGVLISVAAALSSIALMGSAAWFLSAMGIAGATGILINIFIPSALIRMFALSRTAFRYLERLVTHNATFKIIAALRSYLFERILQINFKEALNLKKSDCERRFRENTMRLEYAFLKDALPKLLALIICTAAIVFIGIFDCLLAFYLFCLIFICAVLIPWLFTYFLCDKTLSLSADLSALNDGAVKVGEGLTDLILNHADKKLKADLLMLNKRICKVRAVFTLVEDMLLSITYLASAVALILSLYLIAPYYAEGKVNGACYVLLGIISFSMFEAVFPLALSFTKFAEVRHAFNEINALINLPKNQNEQGQEFDENLKRITFKNVCFSYSKEMPLIINHFSASFVNCKNYALCAEVGSGKTTLVYLMTSLLKDYDGIILLNGKDLKSFSGSSIRKCFSVAPQSNDFFSGTILDLFKEVNPEIDEKTIFKLLDEVELTDFVKSLPLGLNQFLGNNGISVSGGQSRRLVLARALCRNCDFLILDEPGEGLDIRQGQRILKRILCSRKGVILISHKSTGLNFCDEIIRI